MASRHLVILKSMCLEADIHGKTEQREALGWALARLSELTGSKIADALAGKRSDADTAEMQAMQAKIDDLEAFVDFVCYYAKKDRRQMENQHKWRMSLSEQ